MFFKDRQHAGTLLADKLAAYKGKDIVVFGLARGGVVVAHQLANILHTPLDVLVIKKISSPMNPEFAIGALAPDGVSFINWKLAQRVGVDERYIKEAISRLPRSSSSSPRPASHSNRGELGEAGEASQTSAIRQKTLLYRKGGRPYRLKEKVVLLVDDGAATGATMEAAVKWCRKKHARRIIVALPVAPTEFVERVKHTVDHCIVLYTPTDFSAVGQFYKKFPQVEDREVIELLQ